MTELFREAGFVPYLLDERGRDEAYAAMMVKLRRCQECGHWMLPKPQPIFEGSPFPRYVEASFDAQRERAGWRVQATETVCRECLQAGALTVRCALCHQRKPSSAMHQSFGLEDVDYLCSECWETKPARLWYETVNDLEDKHRWDAE